MGAARATHTNVCGSGDAAARVRSIDSKGAPVRGDERHRERDRTHAFVPQSVGRVVHGLYENFAGLEGPRAAVGVIQDSGPLYY
jgi:hypothetical protein